MAEESTISFNELVRTSGYYAEGCRMALRAAGVESEPGPGRRRLFPRAGALEAIRQYRDGTGGQAMLESKARRVSAEAGLAELEVKRRMAGLVTASAAKKAWASHVEQARERLLQIGPAVADEIAVASDAREVERLLMDAVCQALEDVSHAAD